MRQHALTHKNSDGRSNSPNADSSNTNSDNEQSSQLERNRDNENEQSEDEGENINDDSMLHKMSESSPQDKNTLSNNDEEKAQLSSTDQDDTEDISRSQSNSSKSFITSKLNNILYRKRYYHNNQPVLQSVWVPI